MNFGRSLERLDTSTADEVNRHGTERVTTDDWSGYCEAQPNVQPNGRRLGPCSHCVLGAHHMCTGVGCFGCQAEHRGYGVASGSDGLPGGSRPEGKGHRR